MRGWQKKQASLFNLTDSLLLCENREVENSVRTITLPWQKWNSAFSPTLLLERQLLSQHGIHFTFEVLLLSVSRYHVMLAESFSSCVVLQSV